jgi:hypothetical protein
MTTHAPARLLILILALAAALLAAAPARAQGQPYYDVTDAAAFPGFIPAKCDGSDDTSAFQAAIDQARRTQATIEVPLGKTCVIAGSLNFQNTRGVCLMGGSGAPSIPFSGRPHLKFTTGSSNPLITFGGSIGFCLMNLFLESANAGFSGSFVEGGGTSGLAAMATFQNLLIVGSSQSAGPACLISLDHTYSSLIDNVWFEQAQVDVCGVGSSNFSGFNTIRNSFLIASVALIKDASDGWSIGPNNHLNISAPALSIPDNISCLSINLTGNYMNNPTRTIDVISIPNVGCSITVRGNLIAGTPESTAIKMSGGQLIADGNVFLSLVPFELSSNVAIQIGSNDYLSGSTPAISPSTSRLGRYTDQHTTTFLGVGAPALQTFGNLMVKGAATANGNVSVGGRVVKSSSTFRIDHPLDPSHKYLVHAAVESPDMKNVYDGVVTLDAKGEAEVRMPDYLEALNRDFRYQLTCVGDYAPVYVSREMQENSFRISSGKSGLEVSWMVTGIRHDLYAETHRIATEETRPPAERSAERD